MEFFDQIALRISFKRVTISLILNIHLINEIIRIIDAINDRIYNKKSRIVIVSEFAELFMQIYLAY
jgi:hypothetical protein